MLTNDKVKPANPKAEAFANAVIALVEAEKALQEAKSKVPNYTGQWDAKDYYAEEQEAWNRAADALHSANSSSGDENALSGSTSDGSLAMEKQRAAQLELNCQWLRDKVDNIHRALCPGQSGTWQQRAEQAVEAAERMAKL